MVVSFFFFALGGCHHAGTAGKTDSQADSTLFVLLPASRTHIDFDDTLTEGLNTNVLMYEYFYNGGGVAIGDLNGDGLQDIYFSGNMTDNKLYINQGHMQFRDITDVAGVAGRPGPWKTGVTMADVNGDGRLDIYVCYSGKINAAARVNQLFINQGNDADGVPRFKEMTAEYGLDFPSNSTQAYFFDYDRDGDLDLLLVNHNPKRIDGLTDSTVKVLMSHPDPEAGIRLLRNDNGHFVDVTVSSGIVNTSFSYGLAAGIADVNGDGWPDIYISNDYNVPDRLYINKGNGTFTDQLQGQIGHTSFSSMGSDIADVNNDGLPDIFTLDMLPEDNRRQKLLFGGDNTESYDLNIRAGLSYQYMRNMLQLNNGNGSFSEIGQLAGISNTDWSWAPLFADYDNDGWKDLFISNGYTRDYTNMDFLQFMGDQLKDRQVTRKDLLEIVQQMPASELRSYFFHNNGNLTFSNTTRAWGIDQSSNSNGAAYADLDNDGDLDLVVNNINKSAFIYENRASQQTGNHYLSITLKGGDANTQGIGAKILVYTGSKKQYLEQMPTRGFQSSVSPVLHFGLGRDKIIDSLRIIWPRGRTQLLQHIDADQRLTLEERDAKTPTAPSNPIHPLFAEVPPPLTYHATADNSNDFRRQRLLTNALSFSGPHMIKGDVNGDGLEDIFICGGNGTAGILYMQQKDCRFTVRPIPALEADKASIDGDAVFFDANGDGHPDLYICSGGYDALAPDDPLLQDRLYINDGKGNFTRSRDALPRMTGSKSCVRVADINGDGFPDLFVGGRVIPGRYPETPPSYILINDGKGHFTDETIRYNPGLQHIGMVTDAAWADMNGDGKPDLILVGEWMPVTVLLNKKDALVDSTSAYFDKRYTGWWNCLRVMDLNGDGHPDILAGNLGLNSQCHASESEPAELYYKDFDNDGSVDPILCFYIRHKSYPFVSRKELLDQVSGMRKRFPDYNSYADATIDQIFTPDELKDAGHLSASYLATACFLSDGQGRLHLAALPPEVQFSPVYTITPVREASGKPALLFCGNVEHARLRFGKYDANYGVLVEEDGHGNFRYVPQLRSGFHLKGDVRAVLPMGDTLLFGINQKGIVAYKPCHDK